MMKNIPVYKHPASYAREHDELAAYRASKQANTACKEAIEAAIRDHYRDNRLDAAAVNQVVQQFGYDRTFHSPLRVVLQQPRLGEHPLDARIECFIIIRSDKPVFAVAQQLMHTRNVSGDDRLPQDQAFRDKGAEALKYRRAYQKVGCMHQVIRILSETK